MQPLEDKGGCRGAGEVSERGGHSLKASGRSLDQFLLTCESCTPAQWMRLGFPELPHFYMKDGHTAPLHTPRPGVSV